MQKKIKRIFKVLGPGFITGISDDDPSGIGTYAQTGAQFGYAQLWMPLFCLPFMSVIQEMCGRIGMVTGKGLAGVIRIHYAQPVTSVAVALLLVANTLNIGADLGAMAATGQMLLGIPFVFWLVGMTVTTLLLEVFVSYHVYSRYLKYLAFSVFAYILTAFVVQHDWQAIGHAIVVPYFSGDRQFIMNVVALLGTTISPYLFFWQASEEVEDEVESKKLEEMGVGEPLISQEDVREITLDTATGMFFAVLVMFAIILVSASTLSANGIHNIETAPQAAEALRPLAGEFSYLLFAVGIIGTGLLAVPVLAGSASYALSEAFGWREGLYLKFKQAHGFYGVITIATLVGLLINFTGIPPFRMLYYTAIINGLCAPPLMAVILLVANNGKIMGNYKNALFSNALGWIITGIMACAAVALIVSLFQR